MQEIIRVLKDCVAADDIEDLDIISDYKTMETTISFCFYYVEFLANTPFFSVVLPNAKRVSMDGIEDGEGRGKMTLIFNGVLNKEAS